MNVITITLLLCVYCLLPMPACAESLFGVEGKYKTDNSSFYKWNQVQVKHREHVKVMRARCKGKKDCHYKRWQTMLGEAKKKSLYEKLAIVNNFHNKHPYILDIINWGLDDYWASPYEFTLKDGDCEDYAVAKYMSLRELGMSADAMRLVILRDNNLNVLHTIVAVKQGQGYALLDNQIKQVISDGLVKHYSPIYAINERGWWKF